MGKFPSKEEFTAIWIEALEMAGVKIVAAENQNDPGVKQVGDVVSFGKAERLVWVCGQCGCSTLYLYDDSSSECAGCGRSSDAGEWVTPLQDRPKSPEKDNGGCIDVISIGTVDFARRRVLKKICDAPEALALVVGWNEDGNLTAWSAAGTPAQRDWAARKLRELAESYAAIPDSRYDGEG